MKAKLGVLLTLLFVAATALKAWPGNDNPQRRKAGGDLQLRFEEYRRKRSQLVAVSREEHCFSSMSRASVAIRLSMRDCRKSIRSTKIGDSSYLVFQPTISAPRNQAPIRRSKRFVRHATT